MTVVFEDSWPFSPRILDYIACCVTIVLVRLIYTLDIFLGTVSTPRSYLSVYTGNLNGANYGKE